MSSAGTPPARTPPAGTPPARTPPTRTPPARGRLTAARLALTVGGAFALLLIVVALAPLIGLAPDGAGGQRLVLLDLGHALAGGRGNADAEIFLLARLPRALAGALAGAGLAAAGVAYQALLRNPLAEPYTLGVSSGASLGAVIAIRLGAATWLGSSGIALAAFAGALLAATLIGRLARVGRALPAATLLLAGVTLALLCSAASALVQYTASFTEAYRIVRWMMGGLDWILYPDLARSAVAVALGIGVLLYHARELNALATGRESAASIGVDPDRVTRIVFFAASLVVAAVISVAGPIGFVGLIAPHAVRAIAGADHRVLLPAAIAFGGAFVVVCDTLARLVLAPAQLPVGIITALIGAPFFLALLAREKGRSLGE